MAIYEDIATFVPRQEKMGAIGPKLGNAKETSIYLQKM